MWGDDGSSDDDFVRVVRQWEEVGVLWPGINLFECMREAMVSILTTE